MPSAQVASFPSPPPGATGWAGQGWQAGLAWSWLWGPKGHGRPLVLGQCPHGTPGEHSARGPARGGQSAPTQLGSSLGLSPPGLARVRGPQLPRADRGGTDAKLGSRGAGGGGLGSQTPKTGCCFSGVRGLLGGECSERDLGRSTWWLKVHLIGVRPASGAWGSERS